MKKMFMFFLVIMLLATLVPFNVANAGMVYRYKLMAGKDTQVGVVEVWNDAETLFVKYQLWSMSYCLMETHLHVADTVAEVPQNNGGPIPGQFDYKMEHNCSTGEVLYQIPLSAGAWTIGERIVIVAHATVGQPNNPDWSETAWSVQCSDFVTWAFPGKNWAAYMEYPIHL